MRRRMAHFMLVLLAGFLFGPALPAVTRAQDTDQEQKKSILYEWMDDKGVSHVTDDPAKIPEKYTSRVRKKEMLEPKEGGGNVPAAEPAAAPGGEGGNGLKATFQARMQEWKAKLADAEKRYQDLEQKRDEALRSWGGPASGRLKGREDADKLEEQMKNTQQEIDEAKHMINDVIPDEARRAGVPPGWLRE